MSSLQGNLPKSSQQYPQQLTYQTCHMSSPKTHLLRLSCNFWIPSKHIYAKSPNIKIFRSRYICQFGCLLSKNARDVHEFSKPKGKPQHPTPHNPPMAPPPVTSRTALCRGTGCFRATFNDGIRNTIRCDLFYVKLRLLEAKPNGTEGGLKKSTGVHLGCPVGS